MIETPVVCIDVQRAGPATEVPTKTEQGDLWQVMGAGQGDYPRIIVAPTTIEDCFKTIPELVAYAKANPDKVNYGTTGMGAGSHLFMEMLQQAADLTEKNPELKELVAHQRVQIAAGIYSLASGKVTWLEMPQAKAR